MGRRRQPKGALGFLDLARTALENGAATSVEIVLKRGGVTVGTLTSEIVEPGSTLHGERKKRTPRNACCSRCGFGRDFHPVPQSSAPNTPCETFTLNHSAILDTASPPG